MEAVKKVKNYQVIQWTGKNKDEIEQFISEHVCQKEFLHDLAELNGYLSLTATHTNNVSLTLPPDAWLIVKKVKKGNGTGWNTGDKYLIKMVDCDFQEKYSLLRLHEYKFTND